MDSPNLCLIVTGKTPSCAGVLPATALVVAAPPPAAMVVVAAAAVVVLGAGVESDVSSLPQAASARPATTPPAISQRPRFALSLELVDLICALPSGQLTADDRKP